jgi:hypothetical protein
MLVLVKSAADFQPPQINEERRNRKKEGIINLSRGDTYER